MVITDADNNTLLDIEVDDSSYRRKVVMGENTLQLDFSLPEYLNDELRLPVGCRCVFQGETYYLQSPKNFKQVAAATFSYTLIMEGAVGFMKLVRFKFLTLDADGRLNTTPTVKFPFTGRPEAFLQLLVDCMNEADAEGGWQMGEYLDSDEITMDFNLETCYEALDRIAGDFNTEWEVAGKTIHLRKVEKTDTPPLELSYGMNQGILPGLERTTYKPAIGRVWVQTSNRNIDASTYGASALRLPSGKVVNYGGVDYTSDASGSYVQPVEPTIKGNVIPEEGLDLTKIYPMREGVVTGVVTVDADTDLYDIIDDTIPDELDYSKMVIPGEVMAVIFQSGQLAGVGGENGFEVAYRHTGRRFELAPFTENGLAYPHGTLIPAVGDRYAVFRISMPQTYIDDAQNRAMQEAVEFLTAREHDQYTFTAPVDELFIKRNYPDIGPLIDIGRFVRLSSDQYLPQPVDIRITSITQYVNKPDKPQLELSNEVKSVSFSTQINKPQALEQTIDRKASDTVRLIRAFGYLRTALQNTTTIDGGLILTTLIQLGLMCDGEWINTAGVNGVYEDENDIAFYAGGTLQQAINLRDNPEATNDVAAFVVTHGGKVIMNQAILRGRFESNVAGNRIIIDPSMRQIKLISASGRVVGSWQFNESGNSILNVGGTAISPFGVDNATDTPFSFSLSGQGISCLQQDDDFNVVRGFSATMSALNNYLFVRMMGLPTTSNGLPTGYLYLSGDTIKIKT